MSENNQEKSFVKEMSAFLNQTKKWWLLPIIVFASLLIILILLSVSGISSFIYSIF